MRVTDFLTIRDFTTDELLHLLELARNIKEDPARYATALKGKTLALIFEKPSLRTRVSFDVGIQQLGGFSVYLSPAEINLGKRESVYDVAKNLERMVQGIMIRTFGHDIVEKMAEYARIPVINGLTDLSHPCQAMADYLTILEHKGRLGGLKLAYVGDSNNVSNSLMFAGARLGVHVAIASPAGYQPKPERRGLDARSRRGHRLDAASSRRTRSRRWRAPTWSTRTRGPAWARRPRPTRARRCSAPTR